MSAMVSFLDVALMGLMLTPSSGVWTPPPIVTIPPPVYPSVSTPPSTIEWEPPKPIVYTPPKPTVYTPPTVAPLPDTTTTVRFHCESDNRTSSSNASTNSSSANATLEWSEEKRKWCCQQEHRGCTTITSTSTNTETSTVTRTTSTTTTVTATDTTTTVTVTTTIDGCGLTYCSMKESPGGKLTNGTCREHIHNLSFHMFLGDDHSCSRARDFVLGSCDQCSICPLKLAGCGVLDYPPTTTTTPGPCQADCTFQGQTATCGARIEWASKHQPLFGQPDACPRAHALVKTQCSVCEQCTLDMPGAGCTASDTAIVGSYDCQANLRNQASQWSADKKTWCCAHKKVGCDDTDAVRVLIDDYEQDSQQSEAISAATWSRRVIAGVSGVGFVTFAAVLTVLNRRPARGQLDGYSREVEIKSFEDILAE